MAFKLFSEKISKLAYQIKSRNNTSRLSLCIKQKGGANLSGPP
jgi:hypothetical protein